MKIFSPARSAGFTITELLIGITLSSLIMAAVLSSYTFLGRNFARLMNQQTLEAESRRTVQTLTRDVRMASGFSGTPTATSMVLILPTGNVTYTYNNTTRILIRTPDVNLDGNPDGDLDGELDGDLDLVLLRNITDGGCTFSFYDTAGRDYPNPSQFTVGIKQVSLTFSIQTGDTGNFTQTRLHTGTTSRLLIRNKGLLEQ